MSETNRTMQSGTSKMPKIIALGSQKSIGKSTLAKYLITILRIRNHGKKIGVISFADNVKDVSYQIFGWTGIKPGIFYESHYKEKEIPLPCGLSPRDIWIQVGNKMREIDKRAWILSTLHNIDDYDILIIPDLRFWDEAIALEEMKACLVKLNRDVPRGNDPAEVSLLGWNHWCMNLDNNGTLQDLYQRAEEIADYLEKE